MRTLDQSSINYFIGFQDILRKWRRFERKKRNGLYIRPDVRRGKSWQRRSTPTLQSEQIWKTRGSTQSPRPQPSPLPLRYPERVHPWSHLLDEKYIPGHTSPFIKWDVLWFAVRILWTSWWRHYDVTVTTRGCYRSSGLDARRMRSTTLKYSICDPCKRGSRIWLWRKNPGSIYNWLKFNFLHLFV